MADAQWEKTKQGTFVLFNIRGDPKSYVRCAEVVKVNNEEKSFTTWFYIHRVPTKKGQPNDFERPVGMARFTAEYCNKRGKPGHIDKRNNDRCIHPYRANLARNLSLAD